MIYQVLGEMDRENIGGFTFDDFFRFAIRGNVKETRAEVKKQFNLFDGNREGNIKKYIIFQKKRKNNLG